MKKIKRMLLAVDGNYDRQAFISEAVTLAKDSGGQITLLSVVDAPPESHETSTESSELQQWIAEDNLQQMQDIASEFANRGIKVAIKQSTGKRYQEIIREVIKDDYDLVMKPAEGRATFKSIFFGSTDMQLFRMCPCPMWAFKPTHNTELRKVMVAVDLLEHDEEKLILADTVLQWGKYVAELVNAELHVMHVWSLYGEATLRSRSVLSDRIDQLVQDEENKKHQLLNESLIKSGLSQEKIKLHFRKGEARKLIPEVASAIKADLLVMGTVGRSGIPGFFIGNTADSVLRQVDCSVLAIKPEKFSTPIELDYMLNPGRLNQ